MSTQAASNLCAVATEPFYVKNCSLAAIATGESASSLLELRDKILKIDPWSIYHHFWGGRVNPQFTKTQHHNDFANWIYLRLHDSILAEKLSIIDPTSFENLEQLRQELLETIEDRLDEYDIILSTKREDRFHFIKSTLIIFERTYTISQPEQMHNVIKNLPPGSIFYHFIDARLRTPERLDDFSTWLKQFGQKYEPLIATIKGIDPYFLSLKELREELATAVYQYFNGDKS